MRPPLAKIELLTAQLEAALEIIKAQRSLIDAQILVLRELANCARSQEAHERLRHKPPTLRLVKE